MLKRCWFLGGMFLTLAQTALGAQLISTGTYASGNNITVDGTAYRIRFSDQDRYAAPAEVLLESAGKSMIVGNASCKEEGNIQFCLNSIYFTYPNATHKNVWEASLSIYSKTASVQLTKTIDDAALLIGQETDVAVALKNTGDWKAADVVFVDRYPSTIGLTINVEGCSLSGSVYKWEGALEAGQEHACRYTIAGKSGGKNDSVAEVVYFDGSSAKTDSLKSKIEVFNAAIQAVPRLAENASSIGRSNRLEINITNTNPEHESSGAIELMFPPGTVFGMRSHGFEKDGTKLTKRISLDSKKGELLVVNFSGTRSGRTPIKAVIESRINGFAEEQNIEIPLTVLAPEPGIRFQAKERAQPGERVDFAATVYNPSSQKMRDVQITTETSIPGIQPAQITLGELIEDKDIASFSYTAERGVYSYLVQIAYATEFGERLTQRFEYETVVEEMVEEAERIAQEESPSLEAVPQEAAEAPQLGQESRPAEPDETDSISSSWETKGWLLGSTSRLFAAINIILLGVLGVVAYLAVRNPKIYK